MSETESSYEMQPRNDEHHTTKDGQTTSGLSAGKIFYKPGVIEEETDETSAFDSSVVDTPMLGMGLGGSQFLRPPQIYPSSSLHRIPTYSSSIGHSTVYRQDTCSKLIISDIQSRDTIIQRLARRCAGGHERVSRDRDIIARDASGGCPLRDGGADGPLPVSRAHDAAPAMHADPESPTCREESQLLPDEWLKVKPVPANGNLSPGVYYPTGSKRSRSHRHGATRRTRRRAILKNGECNILKSRISQRRLRFLQDMFTTLVDTQWRWTLLVFTLSFILSWLGFALIWWLIAFTHGDLELDHLPPMQEASNWKPCVFNIYDFTSCFLFSIETQHTIGYGSRTTTEECPEAIFIMCLQSIVGVMIQAFMVGIVFAKMTRPKHRTQTLLFSKYAVVCQRDGELCLMFRVGDLRKSHIIGASVRAQLIRSRTTKEGEVLSHYQTELELNADGCDSNLFFIWPITMVHKINADSPFYGVSAADVLQERFEIVVILEGTIESTGQTTQARSSYTTSEIMWGHRFLPLVTYNRERQGYEVDYSKFEETMQVDTPLCSAKELDEFYGSQGDRRSIESGDQHLMVKMPERDHPQPKAEENDGYMAVSSSSPVPDPEVILRRSINSILPSLAPSSPLTNITDRLVADAIRRASLTRRPSSIKYPPNYFNSPTEESSSSSEDEAKKRLKRKNDKV